MRDFLECRSFVVHLRSEHKHIHEAISAIERELNSVASSCEPAEVCESLRRLREKLALHFDEEDQGGCMEEAVSCVPRLSADVAEIEKDHAKILKLNDRLIKRAAVSVTDDFREAFRQFAKVLQAHESAESRILHTAFGTGDFETEASTSAYGE